MKIYNFALIGCIFLSGCATILHGTTQEVSIATDPPGADIYVVSQANHYTAPVNLSFDRDRNHLIEISHPGCVTQSVTVQSRTSKAVWGNAICGGLVGWGVDALSGGQYELYPDTIFVRLIKQEKKEPRTARQEQEIMRLKYEIEGAEQELDEASLAYARGKLSKGEKDRLTDVLCKKVNQYRETLANIK